MLFYRPMIGVLLASDPVSLLLGCSSRVLTSKDEFAPYGDVPNYILAGCATVMANLWDMIDMDIGRFSKAMFTA
ncbi:hypothetical protein DFQ26_009751 [Actinomortierella ambigua]|nr:hypothetical protein DFQ26_009751 [Actinomortierella ambigua]